MGKAARASDLGFEQGNADGRRPRDSLFQNLLRQFLAAVTSQGDAPLNRFPWKPTGQYRFIRHKARFAANVRTQDLIVVTRRIASQDRFHRLDGRTAKPGVTPRSTDVKAGNKTAEPITGGVAARIVPRLERSVERGDCFVPASEHHQSERTPGEKVQGGV